LTIYINFNNFGQVSELGGFGQVLDGDVGGLVEIGDGPATRNTRSCARSEKFMRRTAISSVRSPLSSKGHNVRSCAGGICEL